MQLRMDMRLAVAHGLCEEATERGGVGVRSLCMLLPCPLRGAKKAGLPREGAPVRLGPSLSETGRSRDPRPSHHQHAVQARKKTGIAEARGWGFRSLLRCGLHCPNSRQDPGKMLLWESTDGNTLPARVTVTTALTICKNNGEGLGCLGTLRRRFHSH